MKEFHTPVLLHEVLRYLNPQPGEIIFDGTLGGGGHALAIAKRLDPSGTLVAVDLDPAALKQAKEKIASARLRSKALISQGNYKDILEILKSHGIASVDAVLADLGISSYDLEGSGRGFSFQKDEPLDMRFDPKSKQRGRQKALTAHYIINNYPEKDLAKIFSEYGEEKFSRKIAKEIAIRRQSKEIKTTRQLLDAIKESLPKSIRHKADDSARRIFQAIRIETNGELKNLEEFLPKAFQALNSGGKLAVISFHSLEDRIVKNFFAAKTKGCICPPEFPICTCGKNAEAKFVVKKFAGPSEMEIKENPRSKPAKLRVIQKLDNINQ